MTDFRALCVELIESVEVLLALRPVEARPLQTTEDRLSRARAALADEPAAGEPASVTGQFMPTDAELLCIAAEEIDGYGNGINPGDYEPSTEMAVEAYGSELCAYARAVLARWGNPAPAPPADGEVAELVAWLEEEADDYACIGNTDAASKCNRAVELLQRLSPPQPVPVSERLQQMEDLAADAVAGLRYIEQSHGRLYGVGWDRVYRKADQLKPAHALPLPGQEVEG